MGRLARRMAGIFVLVATMFSLPASRAGNVPPDDGPAFDAALATLCDKRVVMLGEDSGHGAGNTVALKGRITRALVESCGFSAIYFESPIYEFLHLEEQMAAGDAQPESLANAIGAIWAGTREFQPTLDWLWERAASSRIQLQGLDVQVGGITQTYSEEALPTRLSRHIGRSQATCRHEIARLTRWEFDDDHPFDDTFRARVHRCLSDTSDALASRNDDTALRTRQMAWSLSRALELGSTESFNTREEAMALNLAWHHARSPSARIIIWTASSHAVKGPLPDKPGRIPLGMRLATAYGNDLASVGFTSFAGQHGRPGRTASDVIAPVLGSLEAASGSQPLANFMDADNLRHLGTIESRVVAYTRPLRADWSTLFDGIWVLPREKPLDSGSREDPPSAPALPLM